MTDAVVLVAAVRALEMHYGSPAVTPRQPLKHEYNESNVPVVERGFCKQRKPISPVQFFGVPIVVIVNKFHTDAPEELNMMVKLAMGAGADEAVMCEHWARGGRPPTSPRW